jgi:carboxymethylenebutenolidase
VARVAAHEIDFASGTARVRGVLALPDGPGAHPALVVVPDVHGASPFYRAVALRFANAGFAALVIDLYSREGAPTLPDLAAVMRWIAALDDRRVLADLRAAVDHLTAHEAVCQDAIGVTGFCLGGTYAWLAAAHDARLAACVPWYGMLRYEEHAAHKPASPLDRAASVRCPVLGLYGEDDALIPLADVAEMRRRLARAGTDAELRTYAGAGHAFFNDTRPDAYRAAAATDAWACAIAFLRVHLARPAAPPAP